MIVQALAGLGTFVFLAVALVLYDKARSYLTDSGGCDDGVRPHAENDRNGPQ